MIEHAFVELVFILKIYRWQPHFFYYGNKIRTLFKISKGLFGFQNRKCPLRYAKLHDFEKDISRAILASNKRNVNFQSAYKIQSCV